MVVTFACNLLGGVSMGEADLVKKFIEEKADKVHFGRVRMKPGKPLMFSTFTKSNLSSSSNTANATTLMFATPGLFL